MPSAPSQNLIINAHPTKMLFIEMLTRDIDLVAAIIDLADNACDGARRIRGEGNYKGLWVRIDATRNKFEIVPPIVEGSGGPERQSDYAAALVRATVDEPIRHRSLRLASSIHN